MIEIFWSSGSCPAWRVLLALELKGVPYESRLLELSKLEHKTPEMLKMNPRGTLPVLRDGEFSLYEGLALVSYIEKKFPEHPLWGTTAEQTGRVTRSMAECLFYLEPAVDALAIPLYRGKALEQADAVRSAARRLHEELGRLESCLAESEWLAGQQVTLADVTVVPQLAHLCRAAGKPEAESLDLGILPLEDRYPKLAAWWSRVQSWPEFERTYPPHWR